MNKEQKSIIEDLQTEWEDIENGPYGGSRFTSFLEGRKCGLYFKLSEAGQRHMRKEIEAIDLYLADDKNKDEWPY